MDKFSNGAETQGVESPEFKVPDVPTIKKWLLRDLQGAITMLCAVRDDLDMQDQMAVWMHGRYVNYLNRPKESPDGGFPH